MEAGERAERGNFGIFCSNNNNKVKVQSCAIFDFFSKVAHFSSYFDVSFSEVTLLFFDIFFAKL